MGQRPIREKKKGRTSDPFVMLKNKWLDLPAWHHLNGNAVKLLVHLIRLSGGDNGAGSERGELFLSERDAAKAIGVAKGTASVAFRLLEEAGWIRPVVRGHFAVKAGERQLRATVWRLTFQPYPQTQRGPSLEFMTWRPEENQRGQKLIGTGSKIDPMSEETPETGSKIGPVVDVLPSEGENPEWSKTDPHLDIAIGKRSEAIPSPSERPSDKSDGLDPQEVVRQQVEALWPRLDKAARGRFASSVGLRSPELLQFINGRLAVNAGKLAALRAAARSERITA